MGMHYFLWSCFWFCICSLDARFHSWRDIDSCESFWENFLLKLAVTSRIITLTMASLLITVFSNQSTRSIRRLIFALWLPIIRMALLKIRTNFWLFMHVHSYCTPFVTGLKWLTRCPGLSQWRLLQSDTTCYQLVQITKPHIQFCITWKSRPSLWNHSTPSFSLFVYLTAELRAQEDLDHQIGNHIVALESISYSHHSMLELWP